jgi:osmotically-inducible protein OsmY
MPEATMQQSCPSVDVAHISDNITHVLRRTWLFDPKIVSVTADGGRVRLTGTVRSPRDRRRVIATAWCAPGVTDVENDIRVA